MPDDRSDPSQAARPSGTGFVRSGGSGDGPLDTITQRPDRGELEGVKAPLPVLGGRAVLAHDEPEGISSMTLYRELGISQKAAWLMLHRPPEIRYADLIADFGLPSGAR